MNKKIASAELAQRMIEDLERKLHLAEKEERDATTERKLLAATVKCIHLEGEIAAFYAATEKTPLETVSTSIAIHSLKVLARGRKFIAKDGKPSFTPANVQAQKLLECGHNDTSGIVEDLISAVTLAIWEQLTNGTIILAERIGLDGKPFHQIQVTDESDTDTMRGILNVVQFEFYQNQQKHFAHEYRPIIDESGAEDTIMVTMAMREYEKSIAFIGEDELLASLKIVLTDREQAVLQAKLQTKQVERSYSDNGVSKFHYVSRYATIPEMAETVGISEKQVRGALSNIKVKCESLKK